MIKKIITLSCVFFFSVSIVFAQDTTIISPGMDDVQCNHWGWVKGNAQTAWKNTCTPLEVRTADNQIYSIATTAQCSDDYVALYVYRMGGTAIDFIGCFPK